MVTRLSDRAVALPPSGTLSVQEQVNELKRKGVEIVSFSNRPGTPKEVIEAAQRALAESWSSAYTDTRGILELRQAIAEKSWTMNGIRADPATEVLVTVGAKQAMFLAVMALVNPGDEVLLPDPEWVSYEPCVALAGGRIARFPLLEKNAYQPDPADLVNRVTSKTKMVIINTPHNPTGGVFESATLRAIADIAQKHNLVVLSDEVYEHYVYDGNRHVSIASLPDMRERTITLSSSSKILNMFGWRVGWAIGPSVIIDRMANIHQHTAACATSFAQAGMVAALKLGQEVIARRVSQYDEARRALIQGLNSIPDVTCHRPAGAYFAFPSVRALRRSSEEASRLLLQQAGIHSVAGSAFGPSGEGHIRLVFACTAADVRDGIERLRAAIQQLS